MDEADIKLSRLGKISIKLDSPFFYLNETVTGMVYLDVIEDGFMHDTVYLIVLMKQYFIKLSGIESVVKSEDIHTYKLHNEFYK